MIFLAGGFTKFKVISNALRNIPSKKYKDICVFDGCGNLPWNGGRVNLYNEPFNLTKYKYFQSKGIGFYMTFSNDIIDTSNSEGNKILDILNKGKNNGVIISDDNFRLYLRENYPNLKICLSITSFKDISVPENIKELENNYDLICPRFEMIFNPDFLKVINPKKYKIMLNDTCKYGCKLWRKHFSEISRVNRENNLNIEEQKKIQECWLPNFDPNIESEYECMDLSKDAIEKCKKIGYEHFKISGREMTDTDFREELSRYLLI